MVMHYIINFLINNFQPLATIEKTTLDSNLS